MRHWNVLQLISDWKWTGPAEPVLELTRRLQEQGCTVFFGCSGCPPGVDPTGMLRDRATKAGVEPLPGLCLKKNRGLRGEEVGGLIRDMNFLRRFVRKQRIHIVHTHLTHDHLVAGAAMRSLSRRPAIVRTNHKALPLPRRMGNVILMKYFTDGYLTHSRQALAEDARNFGDCRLKMAGINPAVDLERFQPRRPSPETRRSLGLSEDDIVAGIVARVQRHRKFDLFLNAALLAAAKSTRLKFLVVGRGTHREEVAIKPARQMGLGDRVIFAGYRRGDFVDILNCFDMKIFLVPGSDGSCRAVREAMAMGKPVIASSRGMLPELVEHDKTGLVVGDSPEQLAHAMLRLAENRELRLAMGIAARAKAETEFSPTVQVRQVMEFYATLTFGKIHISR